MVWKWTLLIFLSLSPLLVGAILPSLAYFPPSTPSPSVVFKYKVTDEDKVLTDDAEHMWYSETEEGSIIIDLGGVMPINTVELVEGPGGGTEDFKIFVALDGAEDGAYELFCDGTLEGDDSNDRRAKFSAAIKLARFIKFRRVTSWGYIGGLKYLGVSLESSSQSRAAFPVIEVVSSRPERNAVYYGFVTDHHNHLEDTGASSATKCAMDCSKTPACVSFKFDMGQCSLGGSASSGSKK